MKVNYRRKVRTLAKKLGATIEINRESPLDLDVVAPEGHTWSCDPGIHSLVGSQWGGKTAADVWEDLHDRMSDGSEPCNDCGGGHCEFWVEPETKE